VSSSLSISAVTMGHLPSLSLPGVEQDAVVRLEA